MSFLISAIFIAVLGLATAAPGVPVVLTAPLSITTYPLGVRQNTTRAANYAIVPVDQYAIFVPENASYVSFQLTLPTDANNRFLDYDASFNGPLCDYRYQLHTGGWTCGGFTGEEYVSTGSTYNFTFTPERGGETSDSGSGYQWRTGTNLYFGFTADTTGNTDTLLYPVAYVITNLQVVTCPNNTIGGVDVTNDDPLCLPLVRAEGASTQFSYNGNYAGDLNGMVFETTVANNTGLITATLYIDNTASGSVTPYIYGRAFGAPTSSEYECSDTSRTVSSSGNVTIINWYCYTPTPGRFYIYFRNSANTNNFTGSINITTTTCMSMMGGENCTTPLMVFGGSIPTVNNATTVPLMLNETILYVVAIPAGITYPLNFTFSANGSVEVYAKPNGYASDSSERGFPNNNWAIDPDSTEAETLSFLPGSISQGVVLYFYLEPYCSSCLTLVNMTINAGASSGVTSTTVSPSSSGTNSRSTSASGTNSQSSSGTNSVSSSGTNSRSSSISGSRTATTTATGATSGSSVVVSFAALSVVLAMLF